MLTGRENLEYFGMLAGVRRRDLRTRVPDSSPRSRSAEAAIAASEASSKGMEATPFTCCRLIGDPEVPSSMSPPWPRPQRSRATACHIAGLAGTRDRTAHHHYLLM